MNLEESLIFNVASTLRKDDKISLTFLLSEDANAGRHVIGELISSTSQTEENGLFQQFLLQLHLSNSSQLEDSFVEACAIVQNYRAGRMLGLSKHEMTSNRFCGKISPNRKSLYLLADSLTDAEMRTLISKLDDGANTQSNYLEHVFLDWQLRGIINAGPELDSSSLEKLKNFLNEEKKQTNKSSFSDEFYKIIDKNNLGYCIVINNASFSQNADFLEHMPPSELPPRRGSDRDVDALEKIFTALKFTVKIHRNVVYEELKELLSTYSKSIPESHSFFVLIFMSHGTEDIVYTADSIPVPVEALEMAFQRNNCPQMTGKPKILVIQACQGDNLQTVMLDGPKPPVTLNALTLGPERGDSVIAWSTVKGYASFRDRAKGSWFIQELCKEFKENSPARDFVDMVTRVNNQLRSKTHLGMFMVPSLSTSLCKKIKFVQ